MTIRQSHMLIYIVRGGGSQFTIATTITNVTTIIIITNNNTIIINTNNEYLKLYQQT